MLALEDLAAGLLDVELVAPGRDFVYRPLAVAEPFGLGAMRRFDLAALVDGAGARLRTDAITAVHVDRRRIWTRRGDEIAYDALILALGARPREAIAGALTFWGGGDFGPMTRLLGEIERGAATEVVFCLPGNRGWPLPLYELALMTATRTAGHTGRRPRLTIATPESSPLELFGGRASAAVRALLAARSIGLCCGCYPAEVDGTGLRVVPGGHLAADRVVTLPRLDGPYLAGIPHDEDGFVVTDGFARVMGVEDAGVYAAGDLTSFPVKQGGLAAQQADAAAEWIAAGAGAPLEPAPFRPVLRGLLLTGGEPSYLRAEIAGGSGETSAADSQPLWWPPGKIAGRYLGPYLAMVAQSDLEPEPELPEPIRVEVDLSA
jgi:sulfide:quinone oxidoreductase